MGRSLQLILCIAFCFTCTFCKAQFQQKKIDSLTNRLNLYKKVDTSKINTLIELAAGYRFNNFDKALSYLKEASGIANELHNEFFKARVLTATAAANLYTGHYAAAIKAGEEATKTFPSSKSTSYPAVYALYYTGNSYMLSGDYHKATPLIQKSYNLAKAEKYTDAEINSINSLGLCLYYENDLKKALDNFITSAKLAHQKNNIKLEAIANANIAMVSISLNDIPQALSYHLKSLAIYQKLNHTGDIANELYNVGKTYKLMDSLDLSIKYSDEAAKLFHSFKNFDYEAYCLINNVSVYIELHKYDKALEYTNMAIKLAPEFNNKANALYALKFRAEIYMEQGKLDDAEADLNSANQLVEASGVLSEKRDIQAQYLNLYKLKNNMAKALKSYETLIAARDSLASTETNKELIKKELQFNFDKKEYEYQFNAKLSAKNLKEKKQQLLLEQQKLTLSDREKSLQRITFLSRQAELENDRKLQAASLQKKTLQAKLDKQVATAEIFKQNETIKTGNRYQLLLSGIAVFALLVAGLIFYNQYKTRRLNQVILTQKKDLEEINAVKDRMFGIVSHDMRSPVNTLIAFNTLLEDDNLTPDKMKAYSKEIKKTLNHTSVLMENLLNWSSSQMQGYKPELESHSLKHISDDAIDSVSDRALQKGIILKNNIADHTQVFADKNMTELIMRNILSNAIKYTPANGIIELMADQRAGKTTFTITDTGMGMNHDLVMRFNSDDYDYTRSSKPGTEKEKGSGLGLVLCKTFTKMMNGAITATSELGKGSTFKVTLPQPA